MMEAFLQMSFSFSTLALRCLEAPPAPLHTEIHSSPALIRTRARRGLSPAYVLTASILCSSIGGMGGLVAALLFLTVWLRNLRFLSRFRIEFVSLFTFRALSCLISLQNLQKYDWVRPLNAIGFQHQGIKVRMLHCAVYSMGTLLTAFVT
jgi:hypothetical protein